MNPDGAKYVKLLELLNSNKDYDETERKPMCFNHGMNSKCGLRASALNAKTDH